MIVSATGEQIDAVGAPASAEIGVQANK
jgi:hypothetical protein